MIVEPFYTRAERNARYQELKIAVTESEVPARTTQSSGQSETVPQE